MTVGEEEMREEAVYGVEVGKKLDGFESCGRGGGREEVRRSRLVRGGEGVGSGRLAICNALGLSSSAALIDIRDGPDRDGSGDSIPSEDTRLVGDIPYSVSHCTPFVSIPPIPPISPISPIPISPISPIPPIPYSLSCSSNLSSPIPRSP